MNERPATSAPLPSEPRSLKGAPKAFALTILGVALLLTLLKVCSPLSLVSQRGVKAAPAASAKLDLNTAPAAALALLPGIGPAKADAIVAERDKRPFRSVNDLDRVKGIGPKTIEALRGSVFVSD